MFKTNKLYFLFLVFLIAPYCYGAQVAMIKGKLKFDYKGGKYYPVKVIVINNIFSDTTVIDTSFNYILDKIPYGVYELKVDPNYGVTGLKSLIVLDLILSKPIVEIFPITLFTATVCESNQSFLYGKKSNKEYYDTGELYAEGEYKVLKKYVPKFKKRLSSYKKQGVWVYYYKSGKLLMHVWFEDNSMMRVEKFYESEKLKITGYYNSCKTKDWIFYSEEGEVIFKVTFNSPFFHTVHSSYLKNYMENHAILAH